jgi:hypothetical protein
MAETVYLPHHLGVIVGSRRHRPWLADDAQQAIDVRWRGQPAFTSAAHAYAWQYWARTQSWLPDGLSIARTDMHTSETVNGLRRLRVGHGQLRDPDYQVLRTSPAGVGPDEQALAACFGMARAAAARTWLIDQIGADARTRIDAVVRCVWDYGYRLAARDARCAVAGHLQRSVRAVQAAMAATTLGRPRGPGWSHLEHLDRAATSIVDTSAPRDVPDLDPATLAEFRAQMRSGGELEAWDDVLAAVWKHTLRTAVLDAVGAAAETLTTAGLADATTAAHARIEGQPATQWRNITLNDANRAVAVGWLFATARLTALTPRPDAADPPRPPTPDVDDMPRDDSDDPENSDEVETSQTAESVPGSRLRPGRAFLLVPGTGDHASIRPVLPATDSPRAQPPWWVPTGRRR